MLVREMMRSPVTTVPSEASLQEACALFQARGFRHLPVVDQGRLVGVLTDRDLRWATSSLCPEPLGLEAPVRAAMSHPPLTIDPLDPVEDAARVMREHKIGCLPVMEGDRVVGILTGMDILDTLIKLTGISLPSSRLEVALADRPGELARLTAFLAARQVNIHSILTYPDSDQAVRTVLRLGSSQIRPLADDLARDGFRVLWPQPKPWPR
ncbi:MAG TPA: CBS and ACT domain-containing protein [Holophagaceae bacterium]